MDLLFKEYASPWLFLDLVIRNGQFKSFIDTFFEQREERTRWELYVHKLGALDDRTWEQFNYDLNKGRVKDVEIPSDEQLGNTVKNSMEMLLGFKIERG